MPDIKFSQLEVVTTAAANDSIPIIDASNALMSENGSNVIISVGDFADSIFSGLSDGALTSSKLQTNPTFTGNVTLPSTTNIGSVTGAEIEFLSGLRDNVQYQFDNPSLITGIGRIPVVPEYANLTAANAALDSGDFFWDTTLNKLRIATS